MKKAGTFVLSACMAAALIVPVTTTTAQAAKIKLNKTKVYLLKGQTVKLKIKGTKKKVTWKSSKKKVATVSKKGKVKAKKAGKATITAKVKGKKYKCKIIVETKKQRKARLKKEEAAKMIQNAKNLRAYVLKNGSKYEYEETYEHYIEYSLKKDVADEDNAMHSIGVLANPKSNILEFTWQYRPDAPADSDYFEFQIDLTKGTVKTGRFDYSFREAYDETRYYGFEGKINTEFNKKDKGITVTEYWYNESEGETGNVLTEYVTDAKELKKHEAEAYAHACDAFNDLDSLLLKEIGFSMKDIGFTNWK